VAAYSTVTASTVTRVNQDILPVLEHKLPSRTANK